MNERDLMLTSILKCRPVDLYAGTPRLSVQQQELLASFQLRRQQGEPLQYILGEWSFRGLDLRIDPRALIPRPETELLVEVVLQTLSARPGTPLRILECGTGSGNIAISLTRELPGSGVTTVDIDPAALVLAQENAKTHGVHDRIRWACQDMKEFFASGTEGSPAYDAIVSNPPYVPTDMIPRLSAEVRREPRRALDGGPDGLDWIRLLVDQGALFLKEGGWLFLEIGDGQRAAVEDMLETAGRYQDLHVLPDFAGTDRIVSARVRQQRVSKSPIHTKEGQDHGKTCY